MSSFVYIYLHLPHLIRQQAVAARNFICVKSVNHKVRFPCSCSPMDPTCKLHCSSSDSFVFALFVSRSVAKEFSILVSRISRREQHPSCIKKSIDTHRHRDHTYIEASVQGGRRRRRYCQFVALCYGFGIV